MSYKKMRKLLIILLLFCNIFMLFNLASMKFSDYNLNKEMTQNNIEFLSQKGLNVTQEQLNIDISKLNSYKFSLFSQKNVNLLLENVISAENDMYIGDNGTAKINSDGSFSVVLDTTHTYNSITKVLENADFDVKNADIIVENERIHFVHKIENLPVSNCNFEVILNTNSTLIEGNFVFETPVIQGISSDQNIFTLLVDFLHLSNISGNLDSLEIYYLSTEDTPENIVPVIVLLIDGNQYYYNFFENTIFL